MGVEASAHRRETSRLRDLYALHALRATRIAFLITGDELAARRIATSALARTHGFFQDLKEADSAGVALLGRVVRLAQHKARRARLLRRARATPPGATSEDRLWNRFMELPARRRSALVLALHRGISDDFAADALGTSSGSFRHSIAAALTRLGGDRSGGSLEDDLGALMARRARPVAPPDESAVLRRGRAARLTAVVAVGALLFAGVQGAAALTDRSAPSGLDVPDELPEGIEGAGVRSMMRLSVGYEPVGPVENVALGTVHGFRWQLVAFKNALHDLCLEVRVDGYSSQRCVSPPDTGLQVFTSSDLAHDSTFVYGQAAGDIDGVGLRLRPGGPQTVSVASIDGRLRTPRNLRLFVAVVPDYLLALGSRKEGVRLGYRPVTAVVDGLSDQGTPTTRSSVYLGKPKS